MTMTTKTTAKTFTDIARSIARLLGKGVLCFGELALVAITAAIALPFVVMAARVASGLIAMALGMVWIGAASLPGCCALLALTVAAMAVHRVR